MEIQTKYQGMVDVPENEVLHFENGLPGFSDEHRFVVSLFSKDTPFFILQSVTTSLLAFVLADPFAFYKDYDFTISDSVVDQLRIKQAHDAAVYVILTLQDPFEQTTANLQAPLIINHHAQKGKQVVLDHSPYGTRHFLVAEGSSAGQGGERC